MPKLVRVISGDDPRELAEKLSDQDAQDLAARVSAQTGETVQIVPYVFNEKTSRWELDERGATELTVTIDKPEAAVEDLSVASVDLEAMTGDELDKLAEEKNVEGYKKSVTVAERRGFIARFLRGE